MNWRHLLFLALACGPACGCLRSPHMDVYVDALNAEKRALEDQLYDLEYEYEVAVQDLEACRGDQEKPKAEPGQAPKEKAGEPDIDFDNLAPPTIEPGLPESPSIETPSSPPASEPDAAPKPKAESSGEGRENKTAGPTDTKVTHIALDRRYTRGHSFDEVSGDEGVSVLVEPRNAADQYVPQAGSLSIVVLDPAKQGEEARVARWDVDSLEADRCLQRSPLRRGIHWQAPWPGKPPEHSKLELFVRFKTIDGRTLSPVRQEIVVAAANQVASCWTPRRDEQDQADGKDAAPVARQAALLPQAPGASQPPDAAPQADQRAAQAERPRPAWRPYR